MANGTFSLDRFCGGALLERTVDEMRKIYKNIKDPNTKDGVRTLTIVVKFIPDKARRGTGVKIDVKSKLAEAETVETTLLIGQDIRTGWIEVSEYGEPGQIIRTPGETLPVKSEIIPPAEAKSFDQETGEIYEPRTQPMHQTAPIDLRAAQ